MTQDAPEPTPFDDFLRKMLGDEAAEEAARALRAQGFDPRQLPEDIFNPESLHTALTQFQFLMNTSHGPVNWRVVTDSARQAIYRDGDPQLSAAQAAQAKQAMTVADLWLDTVTTFAPGPLQRHAWTRSQWFDQTLPMWKRITEPVAHNVSRALDEVLTDRLGSQMDEDAVPTGIAQMIGRTQELVPKLSAMMFAAQIARALTGICAEAFGSTDVGLPLVEEGVTGLVVANVEAFADGLDIPFDEVLHFLALRECAHRRLFAAVPWLQGDLIRAVENYSAHIAIDEDAIAQAAHSFQLDDPHSIESAFSGGIFTIPVTPEQQRSLDRLETILALIEGWVEVVTARALAPYLPHADQLQEMMRRRRASGGPAEQVLGELIGLKMRPRRARAAAKIFTLVEADSDYATRDALWSHPDMVPTIAELDSPDTFLVMRRAAGEQDADIDAALEALLEGTMGWADGLTPDLDPESETLAKAGFETRADASASSGAVQDSDARHDHPHPFDEGSHDQSISGHEGVSGDERTSEDESVLGDQSAPHDESTPHDKSDPGEDGMSTNEKA